MKQFFSWLETAQQSPQAKAKFQLKSRAKKTGTGSVFQQNGKEKILSQSLDSVS